LVYKEDMEQIFEICLSRDAEFCENNPYLRVKGKWQRVNDKIIKTGTGYYFCRGDAYKGKTPDEIKKLVSMGKRFFGKCTKEGFVGYWRDRNRKTY